MPSPRITFRLPPALEARVSDRVRQGSSVSDIVREALEAYLGGCQTHRPTPEKTTSSSVDTPEVPLSDRLSDMSANLSDNLSDVSDVRERLAQLEAQVAALALERPRRTSRPTARPTPAPTTDYDPAQALARMQALQAQGLSLAQIAQTLTAEGVPTRHGKPWHKGTVGYLLQGKGD